MEKIDPKIIATAKNVFKTYPAVNKLYVDHKGKLHFTAGSGSKRTLITREEVNTNKSNKNNDKS